MHQLTNVGQKTLQIYFWHYPIVKVFGHIGIGTGLVSRFGVIGGILWLFFGAVLTSILSLSVFEKPILLLQKLISVLYGCVYKLLKK